MHLMTQRQKESRDQPTDTKQEPLILASGSVDSEMELESKFGQMVLAMKATGRTTEHKASESSPISMVTSTRATG